MCDPRHAAILLAAALLTTATPRALASGPAPVAATEDVPPADRFEARERPSASRWYGWQTALVDVGSVATMPIVIGVGGYLFGAPIVHAHNDNPEAAGTSLALRLVLPVLGGVVGGHLADDHEAAGRVGGVVSGALAAMVIDMLLLSWHDPAAAPGLRARGDDLEPSRSSPGLVSDASLRIGGFALASESAVLVGPRLAVHFVPEVALEAAVGFEVDAPRDPAFGVDLRWRPYATSEPVTPTLGMGYLRLDDPLRPDRLVGSVGVDWQIARPLHLTATLSLDGHDLWLGLGASWGPK